VGDVGWGDRQVGVWDLEGGQEEKGSTRIRRSKRAGSRREMQNANF